MTDLIVGDIAPRIQYTADGTQTVFTIPFAFFDNGDISVVFDDGDPGSSNVVTGAGQSSGGSVTFDTAPLNGTRITILRSMIVQRTTDFQDAGAFRASAINEELDRLAMMIQQVSDRLDRALILVPSTVTAPQNLPEPLAGALIGWNDNADQIVTRVDFPELTGLSAFAATILDDVDAAVARATLGLGSSDQVAFSEVTTGGGAACKFENSATDNLDFGGAAIASGGVQNESITVTGALVGDEVNVTPPTISIVTNFDFTAIVSGPDTVTIRMVNRDSASQTPTSGIWRATVRRY